MVMPLIRLTRRQWLMLPLDAKWCDGRVRGVIAGTDPNNVKHVPVQFVRTTAESDMKEAI